MTQVFEYKVNLNYLYRTCKNPIALRAPGEVRANQQIIAHLPIFPKKSNCVFSFHFSQQPNCIFSFLMTSIFVKNALSKKQWFHKYYMAMIEKRTILNLKYKENYTLCINRAVLLPSICFFYLSTVRALRKVRNVSSYSLCNIKLSPSLELSVATLSK